ncbi:MAG: hypothetical protein AAGB93_20635 [Planctomycetota bacterium]
MDAAPAEASSMGPSRVDAVPIDTQPAYTLRPAPPTPTELQTPVTEAPRPTGARGQGPKEVSPDVAPPPDDDAVAATLRRWTRPTTPQELAKRGVKKVRSVSMNRMASLIEKAVNRVLIERTLDGGEDEALTLSTTARDEFMRLARNELGRSAEPAAGAREQATTTLDRLRKELRERREALSARERLLAETDGALAEDAAFEERLHALFALYGDAADRGLERRTMNLVLDEVRTAKRTAREAQVEEHTREIKQLERRIAKLSSLLGETEDELRRARRGPIVDTGVGSIYDTVQGIDGEDDQFEQKTTLMKSIFEANLALRRN